MCYLFVLLCSEAGLYLEMLSGSCLERSVWVVVGMCFVCLIK